MRVSFHPPVLFISLNVQVENKKGFRHLNESVFVLALEGEIVEPKAMKTNLLLLIFNFSILIFNSSFAQPTIQWQKCLGGTGDETASSVQQTSDGGYIVAGESWSNDGNVTGNHDTTGTNCDYWVVKLDGSGNLQWQKSFGGIDYDSGGYIQQTSDGGFILAGQSLSNDGDVSNHHGFSGSGDYWIVKLDVIGNIQWEKSLGGYDNEGATEIKLTIDGGYIITGFSYSVDGDVTGNHGSQDYWIVKLDGSGNIQWQKCLGGTYDDFAQSIQQTSDGGYVIAGETNSNDGDVTGNHGQFDSWVVKLDGNGNLQWQNHWEELVMTVEFLFSKLLTGAM
mgnify:CR=1 FL=1